MGKAIFFPFLALLVIASFGGGLGVVFILLDHYVWKEWSVVILGMSLVVGVPAVAALAQRRVERQAPPSDMSQEEYPERS